MIKQRETSLVRKRQIVTAARKLILRDGSEHLTVLKMARQIGVSEGAIYRYFESKKEILSFLLEDVGNSLNAYGNKLDANEQALDSIQRILMDQISKINQKKGISFQIIAEIISLGDKNLNKKAYDVIQKFVNNVKRILSDGVDSGRVREDIDPEAFSILLFGMMQGLVTMWTLSKYSFAIEEKYRCLWKSLSASISRN